MIQLTGCFKNVFLCFLISCSIIFLLQSSLIEGCKLPVKMSGTEEWPLAEIISIKEIIGMNYYYVHYVDCKFYPFGS